MNKRTMEDGYIIFETGSKSASVFLIIEGNVGIYLPTNYSRTPDFILGENDILGEMGVINNSLRSGKAICIGAVTAMNISKIEFDNKLENCDVFIRGLLGVLVSRIDNLNKELAKKNNQKTVSACFTDEEKKGELVEEERLKTD